MRSRKPTRFEFKGEESANQTFRSAEMLISAAIGEQVANAAELELCGFGAGLASVSQLLTGWRTESEKTSELLLVEVSQ